MTVPLRREGTAPQPPIAVRLDALIGAARVMLKPEDVVAPAVPLQRL
ncbi:hypothetical protein ACFW96_11555 [Streptomyces gardneri]